MIELYLLDESNIPYRVEFPEWKEWYDSSGGCKRLAVRMLDLPITGKQLHVSTAFIGMWLPDEEDQFPLLFETTIVIGKYVCIVGKYPTWIESMVSHKRIVGRVSQHLQEIDGMNGSLTTKGDSFRQLCKPLTRKIE